MKNLITLLVTIFSINAFSQTSKEMQYAAYLNGSKIMWEKSIELANTEKGEQSFEKALAMYGLLNSTMANKDEETFDDYVDPAVDLLNLIIEENALPANAKSVLSSVYGLSMAYNPMKGMYLGSRSSSLMESAMKLQPESPIVQKLYAGSKLFTPKMFGGNPEKAVVAFEKAIDLFEVGDTTLNWLYLDAHVGLSMAYSKTDQKEKAVEILNKVIAIEPQYYWAKSMLASISKP